MIMCGRGRRYLADILTPSFNITSSTFAPPPPQATHSSFEVLESTGLLMRAAPCPAAASLTSFDTGQNTEED